ncbi:hypothetical protein LCGC14_0457910 [marine sediment metagenome]|uniref:Uncharacterized protein n=1 Tax=marine sediment metagenome TaxID=412755 RepID=A0A0F9VPP5_9ZZZZ
MAPAIWEDDGFSSGGVKGITRMKATLDSTEEDVPGKFGMQMKQNFEDVEILETETGELFEPEGGFLTMYQNQSSKKNSGNQYMVQAWSVFCRREKLAPPPAGVHGVPLIWERQEHKFEGGDISPAKYMVPVEVVGDVPAHFADTPETAFDDPIELTEETQAAIVAVLDSTNGSPLSAVRREFTKFPAPVRKDIGTAKDVPAALDHLVELGLVEFEDGLYKPADA